jgi:type III secretory pathway component EscU
MAILLGIRGGISDWRAGKPAYFWEFLVDPGKRKELLHEGWHSLGKLLILAVVLDCVYQVIVLHWIYPVDALIVAFFLAIVPYLFVRGPVNRILRMCKLPARQSEKAQAGNPPTVRKARA